jgi:hypothetical protein
MNGAAGFFIPKAMSWAASQRLLGMMGSPLLVVRVLSLVAGLPSKPPEVSKVRQAVSGSVE